MKLLTKEILKEFRKVGVQKDNCDPKIICKFFNPCGIGTWYATEYNEENRIFFGYVKLFEKEWGYFSLDELENLELNYGLKIERDCGFDSCLFSKLND